MLVRMELSRILIRELNDAQIIELREVRPVSGADEGMSGGSPGSGGGGGVGAGANGEGNGAGAGESVEAAGGAQEFSQVEDGRSFPIVIGLPEAHAIERRLKGIQIKRPQTHDLLMNVIDGLGGKIESIVINDLADHTFFAVLNVRTKAGELVKIDSRPSDAIALGIASNVPIFVEDHVLDAAKNDQA